MIQQSHIPLLKALMCGINAAGDQGCGCIVTFCHTSLKMAILLHKEATVRFDLILAVCSTYHSGSEAATNSEPNFDFFGLNRNQEIY